MMQPWVGLGFMSNFRIKNYDIMKLNLHLDLDFIIMLDPDHPCCKILDPPL